MGSQMAETFTARVSLIINAPRAKVWDALIDPQKIKQYILASDVVSEWREGSSIVWKSEFNGKPFRPSQVIRTADYHRVTIELSGEGAQTHLSLIEHGNATERELAHSQGGWQLALGNMKALLEGTSVVPMR